MGLNTLTKKQIHDLNWMNRAAQNVQLGTLLNSLITAINEGTGVELPENIVLIEYRNSFADFPNYGEENTFYVDKSKYEMWLFVDGQYHSSGLTQEQVIGLLDGIDIIFGGEVE